MTDSHSQNPAQPPSLPASAHPSGSQYEGFDPELPEHDEASGKTAKVSTIQVGASAAAAVTSAIFASFFGVAGTLIGAAVGSIVSTVAGAFYADYMRRASKVVKTTTTVVVQRLPPDRLGTSALRRLTEPGATTPLSVQAVDPAAVPPTSTLRPVDTEGADETVVVPVESGTELLATTDSTVDGPVLSGAADDTRVMPAVTATTITEADEQPRSWWRRPVLGFALVGLAGFAIALGVITATEGLLGHPISGGDGGTTLSKVSNDTPSNSKPTPTSTVTVTETATATPSASATEAPSATTAAPSASATTAPTATTAAPSASASATQGVAPTGAPSATKEAGDAGDAAGSDSDSALADAGR